MSFLEWPVEGLRHLKGLTRIRISDDVTAGIRG
jgi:hypothetical protein